MVISGTITGVEAPNFTDHHGNQYQNITIETAGGPVTGRIGCKKPYTNQDINKQGQWELEQATSSQGPYNKLKKHYDTPYQGQPQSPQQSNDANAEGKVRYGLVCAYIQAGKEPPIGEIQYWTEFIVTGKAPIPPAGDGSAPY